MTRAPSAVPTSVSPRSAQHAGPLLVTRDDLLLDDALRLAAAAGVDLDVAHDVDAALRGWSAATLLLVGSDQAAPLADRDPPRREQVHLLTRGPAHDSLYRDAVRLGARDVVALPAAEGWLVELLTDVSEGAVGAGLLVGVVAGSGGAGATTLACALALVSATQGPALLADLDPLGPGVDRIVGFDEVTGIRWDALMASRGRYGSRSLRAALPQRDGLALVTFPPEPVLLESGPVREVVTASQRGNDLVVVDLPRMLTDVAADVVARCDQVVMVVEPGLSSVASGARLAAGLRAVNPRVGVVVRGSLAVLPAERVAELVDASLLASMTAQRRLGEHVDLGLGPVHARRGPLARAAREVLRRVAR